MNKPLRILIAILLPGLCSLCGCDVDEPLFREALDAGHADLGTAGDGSADVFDALVTEDASSDAAKHTVAHDGSADGG